MLNHCQCPIYMCIFYVCHRPLVRRSSPERPNAMYSPCCSLATSWVTMLLPAMAHRTSYPIDASKTSQFSFVCGSIPSIRSDGGTFKFFGTLHRCVVCGERFNCSFFESFLTECVRSRRRMRCTTQTTNLELSVSEFIENHHSI